MLGDTAIAVHPEDDRYQHLIGKVIYYVSLQFLGFVLLIYKYFFFDKILFLFCQFSNI